MELKFSNTSADNPGVGTAFQKAIVMSASLNDLIRILETEGGLYSRLLDAMQREREAMMGLRPEAMDAAAAQKESLMQRLKVLEAERSELVLQMAGRLGCRPDELTLRRLSQTAPEETKSGLRRCRQALLVLMNRLREENRRSGLLCRHIGELLQAFYGTAKGVAASGPVYRRGGRLDGVRLNGRLVRNAI